jgi:2-aminoethylphosphonate-pyruvate transaminase
MRELGFRTLLPDHLQAPIIITFHMPQNPEFVFSEFYDYLREQGYVIYPGKLTVAESFRIGCIGRLDESHMTGALSAIANTLENFGIAGKVA